MQEMTAQEVEVVSGAILPLLAYAVGFVTGGAAAAAGIYLYEKYN